MTTAAPIRVGIGGWTFEPWRDNFYPRGLPQSQELHYASRALTAIEVNGTFYSTFGPDTFAKWRDQAPDGFVFSLKANRFTTNRKLLASAGESVARFVGSGIDQLQDKLGPILWQLAPGKRYEPEDLEAFFALLPRELDGRPLHHVLEPRHDSFACDQYLEQARRHGVATVYADSPKYPQIPDQEAPLAYLRLMDCQPQCPTGYPPQALDAWAQGARAWAWGAAGRSPRPAYVFFINGAKERAPHAAMALIERLGGSPTPAVAGG